MVENHISILTHRTGHKLSMRLKKVKLMNNSVFGKSMDNHKNMKLTTKEHIDVFPKTHSRALAILPSYVW